MGIIKTTVLRTLQNNQETTYKQHITMQQEQSAAPQPVSFEVQLDKELNANPPIRQRLEQREQNPQPTLEQIQDKLEKAGERKAQVIASQISQVKENVVKVEQTQERKSSMERALGQKTIEELGKKLQTAEANRTVQLTNIQEKAKNHNNKVQLVRSRKSSMERAQEEKIVSETTKKHTVAEQRHVEKLNAIQEKCKTHNEKVQQAIASKAEESKEEIDKVKTKIEDKMTRTSSWRTDKQEKAKAYNEKHQQKVEGIQTEQ